MEFIGISFSRGHSKGRIFNIEYSHDNCQQFTGISTSKIHGDDQDIVSDMRKFQVEISHNRKPEEVHFDSGHGKLFVER
jgi:hypothetical protein